MTEELRKKALKGLGLKLLICFVIIVACLLITKCSFIDHIKGPINLTGTINWDLDELDGKYVTINLQRVIGNFAEEVSTNEDTKESRTLSYCYICMEANTNYTDITYYGIRIGKVRSEELEHMIDVQDDEEVRCKVTGTFRKMKGEILDCYNQVITESIGTENTDNFIPYYIDDKTIDGRTYLDSYLFNTIALICLFIMVIAPIRYVCGAYEGYMKRYVGNHAMESMAGIEADFMSADPIKKYYRIGKKYFFYSKGTTMSLLPLADQVWAYYYCRTGYLPASQIRIYDVNKKMTKVRASEKHAQEVLTQLASQNPHIVVGYSENLMKIFRRDFQSFLNIRYNAPKEEDADEVTSQPSRTKDDSQSAAAQETAETQK